MMVACKDFCFFPSPPNTVFYKVYIFTLAWQHFISIVPLQHVCLYFSDNLGRFFTPTVISHYHIVLSIRKMG